MWMRTMRWSVLVLVATAVLSTTGRAWGEGIVLGESKAELGLKYDVAVRDHGTGRVTVVLTLTDEGRLKPLDEVQLAIPGQQKNKYGGRWMDLVVSIDMKKSDGSKRVGRVHIRRELAERAEIRLNTHSLDGKRDPLTRLHHVIPIAGYLKNASAAKPVAAPEPSTNSTSLVEVDSRDFGDTNCLMRIVEFERNANTSKLRLTYRKLGSSVGSSMFIARGFYEVAKARGAEYFVNLKEWDDQKGGRVYIAGFTNTKDADLKKEFGEEFDYENEHGQKRSFLSVSQFQMLFERQEENIEPSAAANGASPRR